MDDDAFLAAFEACSLPPDRFHHADHVRMTRAYLLREEPLAALAKVSAGLLRYATAQGKAERYHQTVTWAWFFMVQERVARAGAAESWEAFAAANPDLLKWEPARILRWYRQETIDSPLAKRLFVMPDRD